jgi:predicted SprT family Zn-dependent metalloprotease
MAPGYDEVTTHEGLLSWSRAYARRVRRDQLVDVRLDTVAWEVSTRAKRRAGALKYPKIPGVAVGDPFDWDDATTADGRTADGRPVEATLSLTWDAFAAFDRAEWEALVRHELVHLEQYQAFGTTGHGAAFERRAAQLGTSVHCPQFTEPASVLRCVDCGAVVAHRYRECKLVRESASYRSSCCDAALTVRDGEDGSRA